MWFWAGVITIAFASPGSFFHLSICGIAHCDRLLIIEISILDIGLHYYCRLIKEKCDWALSLKQVLNALQDVSSCICNCDVDRCMEMGVGNTHDKKKWFYVFGFSTIFNNFVFRVLR